MMNNILNYNYFSHKHHNKELFKTAQPNAADIAAFIESAPKLSKIP